MRLNRSARFTHIVGQRRAINLPNDITKRFGQLAVCHPAIAHARNVSRLIERIFGSRVELAAIQLCATLLDDDLGNLDEVIKIERFGEVVEYLKRPAHHLQIRAAPNTIITFGVRYQIDRRHPKQITNSP
ncbi:MAG: hypothetical protein GXP29_12775 [Planctomycetes bacterium]|nr:hypothetical protein [Planctomycetota bacterium]